MFVKFVKLSVFILTRGLILFIERLPSALYKQHRSNVLNRTRNSSRDRSLLHKDARPEPILRSGIHAPIRESQLADMPICRVRRCRRADS